MVVSFIGLVTIISSGGFVLARFAESETWIAIMAPTLKYSLYTIVGCCAYAGLVGIYHTILFVTGLDEIKGSGKRRNEEALAASQDSES